MKTTTPQKKQFNPVRVVSVVGFSPTGYIFPSKLLPFHLNVTRLTPKPENNGPYRKLESRQTGGKSPLLNDLPPHRYRYPLNAKNAISGCYTRNQPKIYRLFNQTEQALFQFHIDLLNRNGRGREKANDAQQKSNQGIALSGQTHRICVESDKKCRKTAQAQTPKGVTSDRPSAFEQGAGLLDRALRTTEEKTCHKPAIRNTKLLAVAAFALLATTQATARNYEQEARKLKRISCPKARVEVIEKALRQVDESLSVHFPRGGVVDRRDLIALILTESDFYHKCVGPFKEKGLLQVRTEYFPPTKDGFQVSTNIDYAFRVLTNKHATAKRLARKGLTPFGLKKTTIILYNGFVRRDGRIYEGYWRRYASKRRQVDRVLGPIHRDSRMVANMHKIPAKINTFRSPVYKSAISNQELARQLQEAVYGGRS